MADLYHDALIQTGKALQAASKDGRGNVTQAGAVVQTRIPALFEKFHANLNDIESMILDAKATLERDLKLIKARQRPPPTTAAAPATMSEPMAVAPPAPMVIDLESPQQGTTSLPTSSALVSRPAGESRPVAPFPNMDFDFVASPEVPPAKVPTPVMKTKDAKKNSPRPSALQVAAMVGRPSSAPARKETKAPPPQAQAPSQPPTHSRAEYRPAGK
ncbi:hypothetical protein P8C59_003875 [Phyllachora maydis]|nr:hypothetical protein P8C59_003875 [Phyllachora maydis]